MDDGRDFTDFKLLISEIESSGSKLSGILKYSLILFF